MKRKLLPLVLVILSLSVQAQPLRKSMNTVSPLKMGVKMKSVSVNDSPVKMTKSRNLLPAKISAVTAAPGVSYILPQGTLFQGLSNDYYGSLNTFAYASPYSKWTFGNLTPNSPSMLWTMNKYGGTDSTATSYDFNLNVETGSYNMPSLKGTANLVDSTFIFGTSYDSHGNSSYIDAGGSVYIDANGKSFNWTNCLYDLSEVTWTFDTEDYAFGTGTGGIDALVNLYEKPQSTLYFEGVNFFLGAFSAPPKTQFTLRVVTVNVDAEGNITPKDTIATSYATTGDVLGDATAQVMPFTKFVTIDSDGFESEIPYLELDEPFFLELSGFDVPNVKLGVRSSFYDGYDVIPYVNNHAYIYAPDNNGVRSLQSYNFSATLETTLTGAALGYLLSNVESVNANVNGGFETINFTPMFNSVWVEGDLPTWIKVDQTEHYQSGNWGTDAKLTYEPLPTGVAGRSADIAFKTWAAAKKVIHVTQGDVAGLSSVKSTKSKVYNTENTFELTYPNDFVKVVLYNLSGQSVADYSLPSTGKFSIPTNQLSKGIYVLKFTGKDTETLKVIR